MLCSTMQDNPEKSTLNNLVKTVSTVLVFGATALCVWQALSSLPPFLQPVFSIVRVVLIIHAAEGAIAAVLIFLYQQRPKNTLVRDSPEQTKFLLIEHLPSSTPLAIIKAGLYVFFVGTVGLLEIIKAFKQQPVDA